MDDPRTEKWTLEDGRRAERRVTEQKSADGAAERVIELHVEDERPLRLQQRVVERSKPIVYERKVETLDPRTGGVVEHRVESIEPRVQMQLVEQASASGVAAQSRGVTREEMIEAIVAGIKARDKEKEVVVREVPVAPRNSTPLAGRLNSLGLADELAARANPATMSTSDKVLLGVIVAQIVGLVYVVFLM